MWTDKITATQISTVLKKILKENDKESKMYKKGESTWYEMDTAKQV